MPRQDAPRDPRRRRPLRQQPPMYQHLKNMPYLKAVVNEILRRYPSVPFNMCITLRDCTLPHGGSPDGSEPLPVLKNTKIGYSTIVMQRRPELYFPSQPPFPIPPSSAPTAGRTGIPDSRIHPLQRRPPHLHRPAVRLNRDELRSREDVSAPQPPGQPHDCARW
ncbi:hypothetical protein E4U41_003582 [Claviceps citrina]|nr:hypothetical protein E4U41_003582 [Claviceps citrina]